MEKRFYFGIGLLTIFLILGLVTSWVMDAVSNPISQQLSQASQEALTGDLTLGISLARQAQTDWEKAWHGIAATADHSPMDEIDSLFSQMDYHAQRRDRKDFGAYCARLSELVGAVADAHRLSWWNLL